MIYALAIGVAAFTAPSTSLLSASRVNMPAISMAEAPNGVVVPTGLSQLQKDHGKLVITIATTGNINTRSNNPDLPCSPQEMADQMHECIKLGVSILHIHSRNELLKPTMRVDKFR